MSESISRRTLAKGVAWSVPAVALASAAPSYAASGPQCTAPVTLTPNPVSGTQVLTTSSQGGNCAVKITISNQVSGCVTSYNMTIGQTAANMAARGSCSYDDYNMHWTGLILQNTSCHCATGGSLFNRYAYTNDAVASSQTLTFSFTNATTGAPVPVTDFRMTIADISSVLNMSYDDIRYRGNYWDQVGFNIAPSTIIPSVNDAGTGTGTYADAFRRSGGNLDSYTAYQDVFVFDNIQSGSLSMQYTNGDGRKGLQAINVSGLSMNVPCDC